MKTKGLGFAGRLAGTFIDSKLTPLIIIASLLLGLMAVAVLPREEEPQIVVPMVDVFVQLPGATSKEVEQRVTSPMEKLLWEVPGVEYVYSTSSPGMSMVIVRFKVGENEEDALVRLNQKLFANMDRVPPGASAPLVKARAIDDVPVLALTLSSAAYDHFMLRRIAAQLHDDIKQIPDVSEVRIIGGERRRVLVSLDPGRMAAHGIAPAMLPAALHQTNQQLRSGSFSSGDREILVEAGSFLTSVDDVSSLVVGVREGRPIYLRDIASVTDGPDEPADYVFFGSGAAHGRESASAPLPAVTLSVAKRKGTNAIELADKILDKVEHLRGGVVPTDVELTVTRNYGETAAEKSNELLFHMLIAIGSVTLLMWITLGRRESGVVAIAIPVTLALTLAIFSLFGYTLNRVTLFALIFSIGILVDDAIVVVENIVRHFRLPENHGRPLREIAVEAVDEVGNPTILATFAVIAAILPMGFVRGLMGPYMEPIPVGASAAMLFSLLVAFIVTPWASLRLLKRDASGHEHIAEGRATKMFRSAMGTLLHDAKKRTIFLAGVALLLVLSVSLFAVKLVRVKMLPFDNKSEFQIIVDMPEGTTLERTAAVAQEVASLAASEPEVENYQVYAGTAAPFNFNGLVRHYFLRRGANVADVQLNLLPKHDRDAQSHDIALRVREKIQPIAERTGASLKVAEVPPGPPVLQTLVAEIYGPNYERQIEIARQVEQVFRATDGVVDIDPYVEDLQQEVRFAIDREKAALHGVTPEQIAATLRIALSGMDAGLVHDPAEREDFPITLRIPREQRSSIADLESIRVMSNSGTLVPLGTLVRIEEGTSQRNIYHKNLMPVVYVTADVAGAEESPVYAILKLNKALDKIELPEGYGLARHVAAQPTLTEQYSMKWDGEWHITYEVFRDLAIAFAVVLILIYILVVGWFESFKTPFTIMATIPFSLIGIIPMHAMVGTFFTATSMIGFIAGAGIVVRNSIILVDFIELRLRQGMPLAQAVIDAGAVRFRPIMLTASAVVVGAAVMFFDPIFQGLAISLMAGSIAAAILSPVTVPVLYYLSERKRETREKDAAVAAGTVAETPAGA
jgi:multidrug efflux pump subunit AcrB